MSKLERLLNLTAALLETVRPLTAREIFLRVPGYPEDLGSAQRAFQRDKDALRDMGVPIRMIELTGEDPPMIGYRIPKQEYYLRDPELEPDELAALHLAAAAVRIEGLQDCDGLQKLGGRPTLLESEAGDPVLSVATDPRLPTLFAAVSSRQPVTFSYSGSVREFEPHRLEYRRGRWYVTGRDRAKDAERHFRLDKIESYVVALDGPSFSSTDLPASSVASDPWEMGEGPPLTARLWVDAPRALWAVQYLGADRIVEEQEDGAVVFDVEVVNREAFRTFVIGFLEYAEILSPDELRDDLVRWLTEGARG